MTVPVAVDALVPVRVAESVTGVPPGTGSSPLFQLSSINDGSLTIAGGTYTLSNVTDVDGSSLYVGNGASLTLPMVSTIDDYFYSTVSLSAQGTNSILDLSAVTSINGYYVAVTASGPGAVVNLSSLTSFNVSSGSFSATDGGVIEIPNLTTLTGVSITISSSNSFPLGQFTQLINDSITVDGVTLTLSNVTDIDGSSLYVEGGGSLTLPSVNSYTNSYYSYYSAEFEASDAGSLLSLPNLQSIAGYYGLQIVATGAGSVVNLSNLSSINLNYEYLTFSATNYGTIEIAPSLTAVTNVSITVDPTGVFPLAQFTSVVHGTLTFQGGTYTLSNLTDIDGATVGVENGAIVTLPAITSYAPDNDSYGGGFEVSGGSTLNLPNLTSISAIGFTLDANGTGSTINLPLLTALTEPLGYSEQNDIYATGGGKISVNSGLTSLSYAAITIDSPSAFPLAQFTALTDGSLTVNAGTYTLSALTDIAAESLYANGGAVLTIPNIASLPLSEQYDQATVIEADGAGSTINLPGVTSVTASNYYTDLDLDAYYGGVVNLTGLTTIALTSYYDGFYVTATGAGSKVELGGLDVGRPGFWFDRLVGRRHPRGFGLDELDQYRCGRRCQRRAVGELLEFAHVRRVLG